MSIELELPPTLWAARDAAIDGFYAGVPDLAAENAIKLWLEGLDGNLALRDFGDAGIGMILPLSYETDLDVCDYLGIESECKVTDTDRAAYIREKMEQASGDTIEPYLDCYPIADNRGRPAYIGVKSEFYGRGVIVFTWLGLFSTPTAIIQAELDAGVLVDSWIPNFKKFDDFTDNELACFLQS